MKRTVLSSSLSSAPPAAPKGVHNMLALPNNLWTIRLRRNQLFRGIVFNMVMAPRYPVTSMECRSKPPLRERYRRRSVPTGAEFRQAQIQRSQRFVDGRAGRRHSFDVRVAGLLAQMEITQNFSTQPAGSGGHVHLPTTRGWGCHGLTIVVGQRLVVGEIHPKAEAKL